MEASAPLLRLHQAGVEWRLERGWMECAAALSTLNGPLHSMAQNPCFCSFALDASLSLFVFDRKQVDYLALQGPACVLENTETAPSSS